MQYLVVIFFIPIRQNLFKRVAHYNKDTPADFMPANESVHGLNPICHIPAYFILIQDHLLKCKSLHEHCKNRLQWHHTAL